MQLVGRIVFSNNPTTPNWLLFILEPGRRTPRRLTGGTAGDGAPSWSPDGAKVAFSRLAQCSHLPACVQVWTINADGTGERRLTSVAFRSEEPTWSPDGTKIAFTRFRESEDEDVILESDIFVMNADGTGENQLTSATGEDGHATWSPDGTKIAFWSERRGNPDIFVMNADGTQQRPLTQGAVFDYEPDWSPDGARIVFQRDDFIFVMNADGTGQRRLSPARLPGGDGTGDAEPAWSPDGKQIAFSFRGGGLAHHIYVMNADGSRRRNLTANQSGEASEPDWGHAPTANR